MAKLCDFMKNSNIKETYLLEKHRIESFREWPFDDSKPCSIAKMAEAGFYWSGNKREKDTVTCFVCDKTLDGWEATDDPWSEHMKHAPRCTFLKYGRTQKDLTVEETLNVFVTIIKNKLQKDLEKKKKILTKTAEEDLNKFLGK